VGEFDGRAETRSNMVKFGLDGFPSSKEALDRFNTLSDSLSNIELKDIGLEKKRIFEEWAGCSDQPHKFQFWGGMLSPVSAEQWDKIDQTITPERGFNLINRQADYTNAFTDEEIKKHALATYGAENLTLCVSGPVSFDEFKKIIEQSKLSTIPRTHEGGELIQFRDVPSQTHYEDMSVSHLNFNVRGKAGLKSAYRQVNQDVCSALRKDENIALYWSDRERKEDGLNTTWNLTISSEKEGRLLECMSKTLEKLKSDKNPDPISKAVAADILFQLSPSLQKQSEKNVSSLRCEQCAPPAEMPNVPEKGEILAVSKNKDSGR
jgi:hypothetical protein